MVFVSRKEHFNAAHRLYREDWSDQKNEEVYGACANKNWHGHNFELIVTVKGEPDPETGFVVDMKKLGDLVKEVLTDQVDHRNLNVDVPFLQGIIPTCENVVKIFWDRLALKVKELSAFATLHSLKLYETPRNYVEYFG